MRSWLGETRFFSGHFLQGLAMYPAKAKLEQLPINNIGTFLRGLHCETLRDYCLVLVLVYIYGLRLNSASVA